MISTQYFLSIRLFLWLVAMKTIIIFTNPSRLNKYTLHGVLNNLSEFVLQPITL